MAVGRVLTMGYGSFGGVHFVPTLGYGTGGTPAPPTDQGATPGFIRGMYDYYRRRRDEERTEEDKRDDKRRPERTERQEAEERAIREYAERSAIITQAIEKLRGESAALATETAALRTLLERTNARREIARIERELLLKQQAATLAQAQEAALLAEMELNDVVSVALIALAYVMQ